MAVSLGMHTSTPPTPRDPWEIQRWQESRRRWRMLTGEWGSDLRSRLEAQLGAVRSEAIGSVDLSSNILLSVARQLSILHDQPPRIMHDADPGAADGLERPQHAPLLHALVNVPAPPDAGRVNEHQR